MSLYVIQEVHTQTCLAKQQMMDTCVMYIQETGLRGLYPAEWDHGMKCIAMKIHIQFLSLSLSSVCLSLTRTRMHTCVFREEGCEGYIRQNGTTISLSGSQTALKTLLLRPWQGVSVCVCV